MGNLRAVLERIRELGLKLKLSKCFFALPKVSLQGHVIDASSIHVDESKADKILEAPVPTTTTNLRLFLGSTGYYRRFITNFAQTSAVLHRVTAENRTLT